jgi:hypothetical protein
MEEEEEEEEEDDDIFYIIDLCYTIYFIHLYCPNTTLYQNPSSSSGDCTDIGHRYPTANSCDVRGVRIVQRDTESQRTVTTQQSPPH